VRRTLVALLAACGFTHGRTPTDAVTTTDGDAPPACTTTPAWWNDAFSTRYPINTSGAPEGFTLRLDAASVLATDPNVRVVVHGATTQELDRLVEGNLVSFKVPPSGTLWLYAGSGSGVAPANPRNVYLFAEDFDDIAAGGNADGPFIPLPANEWSVFDDGGNHIYRTVAAGRHPAQIRNLLIDDSDITARMRFGPGGAQNHSGLASRGNSMVPATMDGFVGQLMANINRARIAEYTDGGASPPELAGMNRAVPRATWFDIRMVTIGTNVSLYVDGTMQVSTTKTGSDGRAIGIFAVDNDVDFDNVRVRMALNPEPAGSLGPAETCARD
jgi:hypothetical protein